MKRILLDTILLVTFVCIVVIIVAPLLAELEFTDAQRSIAKFQWKKSGAEFEETISIDPFNSEYYAKFGEFLLLQNEYRSNKATILNRAKNLYNRAIGLNPRKADCWVKLGRIKMEQALLAEGDVNEAIRDFKKAVKYDPNGFNTSYSVGYAGISAWNILNEEDRKFILDNLKYSLKMKPQYLRHIYQKLWKYTGDPKALRAVTPANMLANKRKKINALKHAVTHVPQNTVSPEDWKGVVLNSDLIYENGNMFWAGTINAAIDKHRGASIIKIQARGESANNIYPYMIVELDGEEIGETFVSTSEWKEYEFNVTTDGGIKILSVTFANDYCTKTEDRNLYIGEARVE